MTKINSSAINTIVLMRILIGWHFLYEGVIKLYNPAWTSKAYLMNAKGPFQGFFQSLAGDGIISVVDYLNIFGLIAIGLALVLGFWERIASVGGVILLLFYYFSQPPFPGIEQVATEGNYFLVNKNLIEAAALLLLYNIPTGHVLGLQQLFNTKKAINNPTKAEIS